MYTVVNAVDHLVNNAGVVGVNQFDELEDVTRMRPVMVTSHHPHF